MKKNTAAYLGAFIGAVVWVRFSVYIMLYGAHASLSLFRPVLTGAFYDEYASLMAMIGVAFSILFASIFVILGAAVGSLLWLLCTTIIRVMRSKKA